ncbi:MAG TPA: DNRLRE domain-containing protein [Tepidisphaeraceae bacterium]|jgi:hypothetical protein|nr:DNRLRE domain-containing protein [Tepidisphaeraceae bacterium]
MRLHHSFLLTLAFTAPAFATTPFTVIAIPDPQNYADSAANTVTYYQGQMNWIVNTKTSNNIAFVLALGDYQNDGNPFYASTTNPYQPDPNNPTGYISSDIKYQRADSAFDILDAGNVPYAMVIGNHDYVHYDIKDQPIYFLKYFGPQRFASKPWEHGFSPATPTSPLAGLDNYSVFDAGGRQFLNIGLQYEPDSYDLAWAQSIINSHPGMPTIFTTHAMLDNNGFQAGRQNIWDTFVQNNPQIIMTLNGHITGEYNQTQTNIAGQPVYEMLSDYQATDYPGLFKGGGYLRELTFDPDHSVVHVKSYSPIANSYLTDKDSQFDLAVDINGRFGAVPGSPGYTKSISIQDGVNAYTGTRDTEIDSTATKTDDSTQPFIWVDGDADGTTTGKQPREGLIKFANLFQNNRIPANAVIKSATLTLTTDTATDSQTTTSVSLYRMLQTWGETDTWSSLGGSIATDGSQAILAANGTVTPTARGATVSFDVTESVYAWLEGATDNGWVLLPNGNDGWRFVSSDSSDIADRPLLQVSYFIPGLPGDANLDGVITADDYALLDRGFDKHLTGWANGDFNGDGVINSADYLLIDTAFAQQAPLSPEFLAEREAEFGSAYIASLTASLPEPTLLLLFPLALFISRKRR